MSEPPHVEAAEMARRVRRLEERLRESEQEANGTLLRMAAIYLLGVGTGIAGTLILLDVVLKALPR